MVSPSTAIAYVEACIKIFSEYAENGAKLATPTLTNAATTYNPRASIALLMTPLAPGVMREPEVMLFRRRARQKSPEGGSEGIRTRPRRQKRPYRGPRYRRLQRSQSPQAQVLRRPHR